MAARAESEENALFLLAIPVALELVDKGIQAYEAWSFVAAVREGRTEEAKAIAAGFGLGLALDAIPGNKLLQKVAGAARVRCPEHGVVVAEMPWARVWAQHMHMRASRTNAPGLQCGPRARPSAGGCMSAGVRWGARHGPGMPVARALRRGLRAGDGRRASGDEGRCALRARPFESGLEAPPTGGAQVTGYGLRWARTP